MQNTHSDDLSIDAARLWDSLTHLATIGAYADEPTGLVGVNRLALTDGDLAARELVVGWMADAGLAVTVDPIGNIFGRREGTEPDLAPVMSGSHIDTVATAGAFDGCLGVLGALEVVRSLNDADIGTRRPIVVAVWTEEEGARFGVDMLGSAVAAGLQPLDAAYALTDQAGNTLGDELRRIGFRGDGPAALATPPHAYVECHVEQGPVLLQRGLPLGVVTGVQAISWQEFTVHGRAAHAGATPIELRADAGLAAAQAIVELRRMAACGDYGQLRTTVGSLAVSPGVTNVIPAMATFTLDMRNPAEEPLARAEADLAAFCRRLEEQTPGLTITARPMVRTQPVPFDSGVGDVIASCIADQGLDTMRLVSGAGHDAQKIAAIAPTAMIFVRGQYDGISHSPREYSTPEDCAAGVTTLARTLLRLAEPAPVR